MQVNADQLSPSPRENNYLNVLKALTRAEGSITPPVAEGRYDRALIRFGQVICQAHQQNFSDAQILAFVAQGASDYTPQAVLLTAMATAETYLCG
jgi:hypothetical protein